MSEDADTTAWNVAKQRNEFLQMRAAQLRRYREKHCAPTRFLGHTPNGEMGLFFKREAGLALTLSDAYWSECNQGPNATCTARVTQLEAELGPYLRQLEHHHTLAASDARGEGGVWLF